MRLWSIHPQHLDRIGLIALWREGLLAQAVLTGRTRGYHHHPQLDRFREHADPVAFIASYLSVVAEEARQRGYAFDTSKIEGVRTRRKGFVSRGQLQYEAAHLRKKLRERDPELYRASRRIELAPHPCFDVCDGPVASWERPA